MDVIGYDVANDVLFEGKCQSNSIWLERRLDIGDCSSNSLTNVCNHSPLGQLKTV